MERIIEKIIESNRSFITRKDIDDRGIPSIYLSRYVEKHGLRRIARGFYCEKDWIIDPFTLFYFRFMENPPTDEHFIEHNLMGPKLKTWLGLSFELVCLLHVPQLKAGLGASGVATNACCWRCEEDDDLMVSGHQIDLLIDRADGVINLCEMRYATLHYAISKDEEDWASRVDDFLKVTKAKSSIQVTLVTPCGVKENAHRWAATNVLDLDVLFIDR